MIRIASLIIVLVSATAILASTRQEKDPARTERAKQTIENIRGDRASLPPGLVFAPAVLPSDETAWTVQLLTGGGFNGAGRGSLTVDSQGHVTWVGVDAAGCNRTLTAATIQPVADLVLSLDGSLAGGGPRRSPVCFDCYVYTLVIQRRETAGPNTYRFTWDDATEALLPAEVLKLYDAIMALKECRIG